MLRTRSMFLYGFEITDNNKYFNIGDGVTDYEVELDKGTYTPNQLLTEIIDQVLDQSGLVITGSIDFGNRSYTIQSASNFNLNVNTGNVSNVFSLIGFTDLGSDLTGANTYTSDDVFGIAFLPQMKLQGYTPFEYDKKLLYPSVTKTVTGRTQVIYFGDETRMSCEIKYQTDVRKGSGNPIEDQANGLQNLISFLEYGIKKNKIVFYPDRDSDTVYNCILDGVGSNRNGTGYRLKEYLTMYPDHFTTGKMIFRRI